jgi:predicted ester cyclase
MEEIALEVSPSVLPIWRLLPRSVRWRVGAFPRISMSEEALGASRFSESLTQPASSSAAGDIAELATRLATAFPRLVRRVTDVAVDGRITVRVACVGVHEGMWGAICPTKTRVMFDVQHEIVVVDGRVVSDQIVLDVAAIELQLCGNVGADPDETVRMGKARREWYERAKRMLH